MALGRAILSVLALAAAAAAATAGANGDPWRRAAPGYALALPRDHASHPDYKLEWWYYTGHLTTAAGRRFGYQLTFFRVGIDPAPRNPSRWAVRDLYIAHAAVTDAAGGRHLAAEKMSRAGVGWAGAAADRYRVWIDDWSASIDGGVHRLRAGTAEIALDLGVEERGPFVAHGDEGYSRKGASPGNASHYYSLTRLPTRGTLRIGGETFEVAGTSWMDHEFGTSFLEPGQVGWDWFSLQLDDGRDLMLYRFRRNDGGRDPRSSGTLVRPGKDARTLAADAFALEEVGWWTSPESGARYPVEWRARVPSEGLDLTIRPLLDAQEVRAAATGVTYWEGAVEVTGRAGDRPVTGRGYLEMTGYTGRPMGEILP